MRQLSMRVMVKCLPSVPGATPCRETLLPDWGVQDETASNGHVFPFHDHAPKQSSPRSSTPSPYAMTFFGVVAKMKIHPSNASRLGSGYSHTRYGLAITGAPCR